MATKICTIDDHKTTTKLRKCTRALEGKEILVTGGAGFIGSEVARTLLRECEDVTVRIFDDFSFGGLFNFHDLLESKHERLCIAKGDLTDKTSVKRAVKNANVIFHLAAHSFIPECYTHPENFVNSNIVGTFNLLTSILNSKIERFVYVSSCEVYGAAEYLPMDEDHPTRPRSTYAASKLAAENLVYTLYMERGIPAVILRPFNTYGPRDSHPRIIPEIISQLSRGNTLRLGNTSTTRDFSFVSDIANGIVKAATINEGVGEVINLGSGKETSIKELIDLITDIMKVDHYHVVFDKKRLRPYDVERSFANTAKAERLLNWKPVTSLRKGLEKTIEWYKKNGAKWRWEMKDYAYPLDHASVSY